jgi:ABC-type lipoprotein export system ATPase subunit
VTDVAGAVYLRAAGVSVAYGERRLLSGLELDAWGGGLVAVTGPSGAGKTTLLMVLAGVLKPDSGTVELRSGGGTAAPSWRSTAEAAANFPAAPASQAPGAGRRFDPLVFPDIAAPVSDDAPSTSPIRAGLAEAVAEPRRGSRRDRAARRDGSSGSNGGRGRIGPRIGYVPQTLGLAPWLTATENVAIVLQVLGLPPDVVRRRTEKVLADVGLQAPSDRIVTELSGGQRQRVAVARALAPEPELLLADEPTAELDAENRQLVLNLMLQATREGALVIVATHDPDVSDACRLVYELRDGRLVEA